MGTERLGENYAGVWDGRVGFGVKPALICVDFVKAYVVPGSPLYAEGAPGAVAATVEVLDVARDKGVLVVHTLVDYNESSFVNAGVWIRKAPVLKCLTEGDLGETCDTVRPREDEVVIRKQYASAFFGTSLSSMLTAARVDTIVLTGLSTSGCIRATAVDGLQHGFRVIVAEECVGDRHRGPHESNLFDIQSKYGDVTSKAEVLAYFRRF